MTQQTFIAFLSISFHLIPKINSFMCSLYIFFLIIRVKILQLEIQIYGMNFFC